MKYNYVVSLRAYDVFFCTFHLKVTFIADDNVVIIFYQRTISHRVFLTIIECRLANCYNLLSGCTAGEFVYKGIVV